MDAYTKLGWGANYDLTRACYDGYCSECENESCQCLCHFDEDGYRKSDDEGSD